MRPRVVDLAAQPPLVLDADSGLEAVVIAVGGVFLLRDAGVALVAAELVGAAWKYRLAIVGVREGGVAARVIRSVALAVSRLAVVVAGIAIEAGNRLQAGACGGTCQGVYAGHAERHVVEVPLDVLMPGQVAYVLHNHDHRRHKLTLHAKAELGYCRCLVVLLRGWLRRRRRPGSRRFPVPWPS